MDFSQRQTDARRHVVGFAFVVLFHVVVIYALVAGLATKTVDVAPIRVQTRIIEEIHPISPPRQTIVPPRRRQPMPASVVAPDIALAAPVPRPPPKPKPTPKPESSTPPTLAAPVTREPAAPTATLDALKSPSPSPSPSLSPSQVPSSATPSAMADPEPATTPPPKVLAAAPAAAAVSAGVVCSNFRAVMRDAGFPREALRAGIDSGDALIRFTLGANGEIRDIRTVHASNPIFARNSEKLVARYKCSGQGRDIAVDQSFSYRLE